MYVNYSPFLLHVLCVLSAKIYKNYEFSCSKKKIKNTHSLSCVSLMEYLLYLSRFSVIFWCVHAYPCNVKCVFIVLCWLGKNPSEAYIDGMMREAPGPINFTMFLTMFGEKLNGTDPEDVIKNAFACFDEENTGKTVVCGRAWSSLSACILYRLSPPISNCRYRH